MAAVTVPSESEQQAVNANNLLFNHLDRKGKMAILNEIVGAEDLREVLRDNRAANRLSLGKNDKVPAPGEVDEMGNIVLGDVITYNGAQQGAAAPTPTPSPTPPPTPPTVPTPTPPSPTPTNGLTKWVLPAVGAGAVAVGLGLTAYNALKPPKVLVRPDSEYTATIETDLGAKAIDGDDDE